MPVHKLEVLALGEPRVDVDGIRLPDHQWESRHCVSLLVLVAEQSPRAVDAEFFTRTLWPQADCPKGALHATVSRLRKAFGAQAPPVLFFKRGLYRLGEEYELVYDVSELDRLGAQLDEVAEEIVCHQVLKLCRGAFMAGYHDSWVQLRRNHLDHRLQRFVRALQRKPASSELLAQRVEVYRRLLEVSPGQEEAHRGLILSLLGLGQSGAARAEIGHFAQVLASHLETEPSDDLRVFWQESVSKP